MRAVLWRATERDTQENRSGVLSYQTVRMARRGWMRFRHSVRAGGGAGTVQVCSGGSTGRGFVGAACVRGSFARARVPPPPPPPPPQWTLRELGAVARDVGRERRRPFVS